MSNNEAIDIFMTIFNLYRVREILTPCKVCVVAKGFVECDTESYGWIGW